MLKLGQKFYFNGKTFAFLDIKDSGCVLAYSYGKKSNVRFKQSATGKILESEKGEIDQALVDSYNATQKRAEEMKMKIFSLKQGDKILGVDGKEYFFIKKNRTRITLKEDMNSLKEYSAQIGFVKKIL